MGYSTKIYMQERADTVRKEDGRLALNCPNIVALCMDTYNTAQQEGRLYHQYITEPVRFTSLLEAVGRMDCFFDDISFPFASTEPRSFFLERKGKRSSEPEKWNQRRKEVKRVETFDNVISHRGTDATFLIRVQHRQHSSWQGEITWVDGRKKEYFRSALELVRLIDGALSKDAEPAADR